MRHSEGERGTNMQILPNGNVKITNSTTGETKEVAPGELASYNPALVNQYQTMNEAQKPKANFAADLLPAVTSTLGAVGGGALGTLIAPGVGTVGGAVAGSAAGGAAGKWLQQLATGQKINGGDIAREGIADAPFGLLGGGGSFGKLALKGAGTAVASDIARKAGKEDITSGDLTNAAIGGGLTLGVVGKLPAITSGIKNATGKMAGGVAKTVRDEAAQSLLKSNPSAFRKAIDEHGVDINDLARTYVPKVKNYDELLGAPTDRGRGGLINDQMKSAEEQIQKTIKTAGANLRIPAGTFLTDLRKEATLLKIMPGNENKTKAIDQIVKQFEKQYANGLSAQRALDLKRAADSKFGQAVVNEEVGGTAAIAQKMVANASRSTLKSMFPELEQALKVQSDLYTLQPILSHARAAERTLGSGLSTGKLKSLTLNPFTWFDAVMAPVGNSSGLLNVGSQLPKIGESKPMNGLVSNFLQQGAMRLPTINQDKQDSIAFNQNTDTQPVAPTYVSGYSPDQLGKAYMAAYQAGDKASAAQLKTMYDFEVAHQKISGTKKNTKEQQTRDDLKYSVDRAVSLLDKHPAMGPFAGPLEEAKSVFNMADQNTLTFNRTISEIMASIAKQRGGTAFTPNEQALLEEYAPKVGNSEQMIRTKLAELQSKMNAFNEVQVQDAGQLPQITP